MTRLSPCGTQRDPCRPSVPLVDHRKPRPDALYHYPFVDNQGTVEDVLSGTSEVRQHRASSLCLGFIVSLLRPDGQQWSFFDLDSREQERISRKVSTTT